MSKPLKTEPKEALRQLRLPTFVAHHGAQSALAASESVSYDQYLLRLCELELGERQSRKRQSCCWPPAYRGRKRWRTVSTSV